MPYQAPSNAAEAVLMNIAFDASSGAISLRYNDAEETYTQKFKAGSDVFSSIGEVFKKNSDTSGKTLLQFLEFADANDAPEVTPRRLVLTAPDHAKTVLYDDKNLLSAFKRSFRLHGTAFLVMHETQKPFVEELKA